MSASAAAQHPAAGRTDAPESRPILISQASAGISFNERKWFWKRLFTRPAFWSSRIACVGGQDVPAGATL
jgi:hypothetical protein